MLIQSIDKYPNNIIFNSGYINEISFANDKVVQILNKAENTDKNSLITILNTINNQGLQDIDIINMRYKTRNKWLGFSKLCKAERVFLLAYLADNLEIPLYLHTDITQLTNNTLRKFIRLFDKSKFINIVYNSSLSDAFYNAMRREALRWCS